MLGYTQFPQYYSFQGADLANDPEFTQFHSQFLTHAQPTALPARHGFAPLPQQGSGTSSQEENIGNSIEAIEVDQDPEEELLKQLAKMSTYKANATQRLGGLSNAINQMGEKLQHHERAPQLNDTLASRLEKFEEHLDQFGKRLEKVEERLEKVEERLERDTKRIDHMVAGVNDTNKVFRDVLIRIARRPSRGNVGQSCEEGFDTYVVGGDIEDS
ncbi:hypothetical protein ETB97_009045 [Aspergillus alliaceus]|uniref:Uncharacterized protein n=1 Tax=Petromyces alliaceus TaxID=209559 RepID=A0A8H6ADM5_PETAA|nr:hypothetical protein ETB97_009045 [Aspergillus burnettii]